MTATVAVIAGGGFQGQGIVEAIHAIPATRALVVDNTRDAVGQLLADRYVLAPPLQDEKAFVAFLSSLIEAEHIDLIVPATQHELRLLAAHTAEFLKGGARTAVCRAELLDLLLDKRDLYVALAAEGIPVQSPLDLHSAMPFPVFGRPRSGWGGRGSILLADSAAFMGLDLGKLAESHCWVEWLADFEEFSADFAIGFRCDISRITLRRRLRTSGGFAVVSESTRDGVVLGVVTEVARWLAASGGCGLFNVQLIRTPTGEVYTSDINPRHGTSGGHARAEGNNLVAFLLGLEGEGGLHPVRTFRTLDQQAIPMLKPGLIRGVVFDLDDTLIDQKKWMMDKMQLAASTLADVLDPSLLLAQTYAALEEGEHARLIDVVTEKLGVPQLRDVVLTAYRSALPIEASVFAEVHDVLRTLRAAGIRLGLLTDNPLVSQQAKLDAAAGLADYFDAIVFSREHGAEKPAAAGFATVATSLGLSPGTLMMAGDNPARDAVGASAAGYASCLLLCRRGSRFQVHEELLARHAPAAAAITWTSPDLRSLPLALGLSSN